jgi:hypothetical protein
MPGLQISHLGPPDESGQALKWKIATDTRQSGFDPNTPPAGGIGGD